MALKSIGVARLALCPLLLSVASLSPALAQTEEIPPVQAAPAPAPEQSVKGPV